MKVEGSTSLSPIWVNQNAINEPTSRNRSTDTRRILYGQRISVRLTPSTKQNWSLRTTFSEYQAAVTVSNSTRKHLGKRTQAWYVEAGAKTRLQTFFKSQLTHLRTIGVGGFLITATARGRQAFNRKLQNI